ncbi:MULTISPECIES: sugar ABC transporter ATP-binding protein [Bacillus]|uniref:sugar ABC transporter ATP-binding protein n=1 Tax=Bacillus TaxID=1386 RepID=UPI000C766E3F|nr:MULTISPECIES: ATP-binding cassette domain-containing protein [Bacillus]PLR81219.1 sugar ABC transporter ATP-binding protein [Bacillus sp. V33-4]RSK47430.1 ATP-binding cassette domain-containing protein [Bacillus canaveralius]
MENETAALLQVEKVFKQFSGVPVLRGVSLSLQKGEVHAIVGGNGAGKSTLMKIITGLYKADSGSIFIKGVQAAFSNTNEAHQHGVYLVPQEPLIFPNMSVEENILIGLPGKKPVLKEKVQKIIRRLGWNLDLNQSALSLSIAEQQLVEVIRGLVREAEILILDEPTSTLTFGEIASLFKTIKNLTAEGLGVFYITHRITEIFTLAHSVSVLRDGVVSAQGPVTNFSYEGILEGLMPGGASKNIVHPEKHVLRETDAPVFDHPALSVEELSGKRFSSISFTLHQGEVVGIAGVVGAGRTELAEAIFGLIPIEQGSIQMGGLELNGLTARRRINKGMVYVPEDRHSHGVFSITTIEKNVTSTILYRLKGFFLPFKQEKKIASKYVEDLKVKSSSMDQELKDLSGGNQQKVVLAKYLAATPRVIIFDEPTRGIDANARNDIYKIIHELKSKGLAVLLISSDIEEIEKLSDRVLVMHEGKLVKTLTKSEINSDTITKWAFGVNKEVIM